MLYRNLMLFRLPKQDAEVFNEELEKAAPEFALKPVGPMELRSAGWVSPFGLGEDCLTNEVALFIELTLGTEERMLPGPVVNAELAKRIASIRETEGREPGRRERKRIKDEVLTDLLPRAFVKPGRLSGFIDAGRGWVVIDTSSRKRAEEWVTKVRETLGTFPAVPLHSTNSARALMTAWIDGEPMPEGFALGEACELRDPVDSGAVLKCRHQELSADEIREHLRCGKQAFQVALDFDGRLSFEIDDALTIRKLRFHDVVTERLLDEERETKQQDCQATLALQTGEIMALLGRLSDIFGFKEAQS